MRIDAHQHFWQLARGDYGWLSPTLEPLYRDFMPDELAPYLRAQNIDGTILVQAAPTLDETRFLLDIADQTPFVLGVVGWADFAAATVGDEIAALAAHPKLVGLRPMIQDITDDDWMLHPDLTPAFEAMIAHDLTFDALVLPRHLPRLRQLLSRHPSLRCVIDHGAKPAIRERAFEGWAKDIEILAQETAAYCKLSGLVTEAGEDCTAADLAPYVAHLRAQFGADRLIWGSDWPVLNMSASYEDWFALAQSLIPHTAERDAIFGSNAAKLYGVSDSLS